MVRLRFNSRSPDGLRSWVTGTVLLACGPAAAGTTTGETLDAAVSRELDAIRAEAGFEPARFDESADVSARPLPPAPGAVRPVSGETQPQKPKTPTASQLEVMRQLEEMYKRDGREMPSMRLKDAPNTRLPNGKRIVPKNGAKTASSTQPSAKQPAAPSEIQPASGAAEQSMYPAHAPAPGAQPAGRPADREERLSFWDRLRGKSKSKTASSTGTAQSTTTVKKPTGGLFGKLLSAFKREDKPQTPPPGALTKIPPVPPQLPDYNDTSTDNYAEKQPSAPQALPAMPARTIPDGFPPIGSETFASQSPPPAPARDREPNPFLEATEPRMTITPAGEYPTVSTSDTSTSDAFDEIRGEGAPDAVDLAPEFADAAPPDSGAPRPLDPAPAMETETDEFAEVRLEAPPAEEPSNAERYANLQQQLAARSGLGGFQGFCPVALRDRRELIDSQPAFLAVYQGRTYELASAESKARFEANPAKYAPVSGGNDVVLVSQGENEVEGNLAHAAWFKDRLYLFRSTETLKQFNADPAKYAVDE